MKLEEIYKKADSVDGLEGMTVNERLYASGLIELFDNSMKHNKGFAKVILQALKVDDKSINSIVGIKEKSNSTLTPWDFDNESPTAFSSNGKDRIIFEDLHEIAMGAPLTGKAFWINSNNEKSLINQSCGVPPIWNREGNKCAIPIWTKKLFKGTVQKIGVVDIENKELIVFRKAFEVIELNVFHGNVIQFINSPIHKPKTLIFNLKKEKIDYKTEMKN
ncbi:hypothetical protein [Sunxiuqinia elliptica]|uniref:Uncharacterized protein n=1 Tax=Sunxiuqinia elliptica TaxID=655355 RepID=A0A4R6GXE3_9BACT|nr:hypothetical protein [Sunxiuqinia elliptica]TDO00084.1 hypothetical protein DET52_106298 [Sunxiuqinia elliptica]TDO57275.1 hypothetical protein DET65_3862 [Sunxiuqinia elliptica]